MIRRLLASSVLALALAAATALAASAAGGAKAEDDLSKIDHIVLIYEENHSFDNLYGRWEGVNGLSKATPANTIQVTQAGVPYHCLLQNDVNLTSPPLPADCADATTPTPFVSHFPNAPFTIDDFI